MKKIVLLFLCFSILPAISAWAERPLIADQNLPSQCNITPTIPGAAGSYPGRQKIIKSNKVAIPAGKAVYARGEPLTLQGRIYDEDCVPVQGASLELWQADTTGKYKYPNNGTLISSNPAFAGSGKTMTNNMGEYQFITVFPGAYASRAPHIHLRISHPDFETLSTEVFFDGDHRNAGDPKLNMLVGKMRKRLMADVILPDPNRPEMPLIANFDLTLQGKNKFEHY
jgi:protocatechuate 3,4-dioxygenase beta subunit